MLQHQHDDDWDPRNEFLHFCATVPIGSKYDQITSRSSTRPKIEQMYMLVMHSVQPQNQTKDAPSDAASYDLMWACTDQAVLNPYDL